MNLYVGDAVHILQELGDWYLGCTVKDRNVKGVFPKCYVKVKCEKETQQPLVQEITAVLREWGTILKQLYVVRIISNAN